MNNYKIRIRRLQNDSYIECEIFPSYTKKGTAKNPRAIVWKMDLPFKNQGNASCSEFMNNINGYVDGEYDVLCAGNIISYLNLKSQLKKLGVEYTECKEVKRWKV